MTKRVVAACSVALALAAAASAQTPAGPEFRVNTYTTGRQGFARAGDGAGRGLRRRLG